MTSRREERARELEKEDEPSKRLRLLLSINKTVLNKIIVANELRIWRKEGRQRKRLIYRSIVFIHIFSSLSLSLQDGKNSIIGINLEKKRRETRLIKQTN